MNSASNRGLEVGTIEQLLIDDHVVEDMWDLKRRPTRPLRHPANPILYADTPWDGRIGPRSVVYDDST